MPQDSGGLVGGRGAKAAGAPRRPLEKAIVASGLAVAKSLGWYVIKIHGGPYQLAGLPDVLAIKGGHAAWAEFKRPGGEPTKIQAHRLRELEAAGCSCTVVTSAGEYREFLMQAEARL